MSGIGPTHLGAMHLAGSFSGTQRSGADAEQLKQVSAEQAVRVDQQSGDLLSLDDVELTSDRDAEEELLEQEPPHAEAAKESLQAAEDESAQRLRRAAEPDDERGRHVDVEA